MLLNPHHNQPQTNASSVLALILQWHLSNCNSQRIGLSITSFYNQREKYIYKENIQKWYHLKAHRDCSRKQSFPLLTFETNCLFFLTFLQNKAVSEQYSRKYRLEKSIQERGINRGKGNACGKNQLGHFLELGPMHGKEMQLCRGEKYPAFVSVSLCAFKGACTVHLGKLSFCSVGEPQERG